MSADIKYVDILRKTMDTFLDREWVPMHKAAEKIAECYRQGGMLYVFGTGHSHMIAEEFFYRAGGLAKVYPILEEGLMLHNGAVKSSDLERLNGYAEMILSRCDIKEGDVFLIASNSGRNAVPVEAAILAKEKGAFVIALTNCSHSRAVISRHSSGKRLFEVADIVLDNCGVYGDATVDVAQVGKMGATSSIIGCMTAQLLGIMITECMAEKNISAEIFISANTDEGDAHNRSLIKKYAPYIKPL